MDYSLIEQKVRSMAKRVARRRKLKHRITKSLALFSFCELIVILYWEQNLKNPLMVLDMPVSTVIVIVGSIIALIIGFAHAMYVIRQDHLRRLKRRKRMRAVAIKEAKTLDRQRMQRKFYPVQSSHSSSRSASTSKFRKKQLTK